MYLQQRLKYTYLVLLQFKPCFRIHQFYPLQTLSSFLSRAISTTKRLGQIPFQDILFLTLTFISQKTPHFISLIQKSPKPNPLLVTESFVVWYFLPDSWRAQSSNRSVLQSDTLFTSVCISPGRTSAFTSGFLVTGFRLGMLIPG